MCNDIHQTFGSNTTFAPNIYQPFRLEVNSVTEPIPPKSTSVPPKPSTLDIGCFGALRPLKNQLIQAMSAIAFANIINRQLTFHINSAQIEVSGEPILRNIKALFAATPHKMAVHDWLPWPEFIQLVRTMDLGLQVSFSETFDIVAGDFVFSNVPIVVSKEITWMSNLYQADCTNLDDITSRLQFAWQGKKFDLQSVNRNGLNVWNERARNAWKHLLKV